MDYGPIVEAQKLLNWQKKVDEMAKEIRKEEEKVEMVTRNNASGEDGIKYLKFILCSNSMELEEKH